MAKIQLNNVSKAFGNIQAVSGINLHIEHGEFVVLLGPTGAGKTTILRLLAGLETPDQGRISINDVEATHFSPVQRDVTFVFQQYSLYPHLTVFDNMAFPLRAPGRQFSEHEVKKKVHQVAELLNIGHKLKNKSTDLSGGEMQRVAIGRALVRSPSIYLMDEPLSSLDAKLRSDLRVELKRIHEQLGATILYVTHNQTEAMSMGDRIGIMKEGELLQIGTPAEIYETPKNVYVAERLGEPSINIINPRLIPMANMPDGTATIGVRTEHMLYLDNPDRGKAAYVDWVEHLGDQNRLHLKIDGHKIVLLADPTKNLEHGSKVYLQLNNPIFFNQHGERINVA